MNASELKMLGEVLDLLRSKGVHKFKSEGADMEVELHPLEPTSAGGDKGEDPDMCRCGHPVYAHQQGLCIHGCEVDKCAGPEKDK